MSSMKVVIMRFISGSCYLSHHLISFFLEKIWVLFSMVIKFHGPLHVVQGVFGGSEIWPRSGSGLLQVPSYAFWAAHKACVYSVTMRVHARARCDAHHTMHVAQTHMHAAWPFLAKAASVFLAGAASSLFLPRFAKWRREKEENGYRCTYRR